MKKGIPIMNPKKRICHRTTFYSIFNMSSCRKPEMQNDLPSPNLSEFAKKKSSQKVLTMYISSCCNNYLI